MAVPRDVLAEAVRSGSPDRYLATLYAPAEKRPALTALYTFDAEIANIRDRIREALPGEIRLQWWREVIDGSRSSDGHPVADALLTAIDHYGLPRKAFEDCLEARLFDLYDDPMPSVNDLEGYCGETVSAIIQLSALILDPAAARSAAELSGHAGCAQGITGLIKAMPKHRARGQCYVPVDILAAAGTDPAGYISGDDTMALARVVQAMKALAREHLSVFAKDASALPETLRPAFLPVATTSAYLSRLSGRSAPGTDISTLTRHWRLLRAAFRGF